MKKTLLFLFLSFSLAGTAQQIALKKGIVQDGIKVSDTLSETFSLYLPKTFEMTQKWPVLFVFDTKGRGKQVVSMFKEAAEDQGYILAASNAINDTLPLSQNILISSRMFNALGTMVSIHEERMYTGGFNGGAQLASLIPTFIKQVDGVLSCGAPIANVDVLSSNNPFHFIGIVGVEDYNYSTMLSTKKVLQKLKFPTNLLVFEGGHEWPAPTHLSKALEIFTLASMAKGQVKKDSAFVNISYNSWLGDVSNLLTAGRPLLANHLLSEMESTYRPHKNIDSLRQNGKTLRKTNLFRTVNRAQSAAFFKENFIKADYAYFIEEDVLTYNYNNLGWWKYQMEELLELEKNPNTSEKHMAKRLRGYINALIADNIDMIKAEDPIDEEALNFLWMLNTITDVKAYESYLNIISYSSKIEEYGTALFYLEELLKNGFTDKKTLYSLEHTGLFRIMPEFNKVVATYLKNARYDVIEQ